MLAIANGCAVSFRESKHVLTLDGGSRLFNPVDILNTVELYTLNGQFVWGMIEILVKVFKVCSLTR